MSEKDSGEVILSFLLGGLIGAAIGILYAPRAGREIRRKLKDLTDELGDRFDDLSENVRGRAENIVDDVKDRAEHIVEEGRGKVLTQKERIEAAIEAGKRAYDKKNRQQ